jgi:hypothetical protein
LTTTGRVKRGLHIPHVPYAFTKGVAAGQAGRHRMHRHLDKREIAT